MRPIKFRGIFEHCDEDEGSARWIYGSLVKEDDDNVYIFPEGHFCFAHGDLFFDSPREGGPNLLCFVPSVKPDTVGQFTGLYDKNGKEIYEGDIIACGPKRYVCEFVEGGFEFRDLSDGELILKAIAIHSQVVGNIHDNPELLKEE